MNHKGIYLWYRGIKEKRPAGQIAALLTIVIAIIFLFIAITINIGKVSQTKTATNIAADGAALSLASSLGSMGHAISERFIGGETHDCDFNWGGFLGVVLFIVGAVIFLTTGSWALWEASIYMMMAGALDVFTWNVIIFPSLATTFNRLMAKLPADMSLKESAIQYALFKTANDPELIVDVHDYDEDGRTDDKISRFGAWYAWRLYRMAEATEALEAAVQDIKQWVDWFLNDDSEVFRRYIAGGTRRSPNRWPNEPNGVFIDLLGDIEGRIGERNRVIGIVYDTIPIRRTNEGRNWTRYATSQNVFHLDLLDLQYRWSSDNVEYDFSFWRDGINASDETDPLNDEVDFFLEDLQAFREWCINDDYRDCMRECRQAHRRDPDYNCERDCPRGFLQMSSAELVRGIDVWYPSLETFIEGTFYGWRRNGGPLENWYDELLNGRNNYVLDRINDAIEDLNDQVENNGSPPSLDNYFGGLRNILNSRDDWSQDERNHLNGLITALEGSIAMLEDIGWDERAPSAYDVPRTYYRNIYYAASQIDRWRTKYGEFRVEWNQFKQLYEMIKHPGFAEYTWTDSLGEHTVRVEVQVRVGAPRQGDSIVPTAHSYTRSWGFEKCVDLKNYNGDVTVIVTRRDDYEQAVNLGQRLLWTFRSPPVTTSTARVHYNITPNSIYIME